MNISSSQCELVGLQAANGDQAEAQAEDADGPAAAADPLRYGPKPDQLIPKIGEQEAAEGALASCLCQSCS